MKKTIFIIFAVFCSMSSIFAQIDAITSDGIEVILNSDGTWEYKDSKGICSNFNFELYNLAKKKIQYGEDYDFYFYKAWEYVHSEGEKSYNAVVYFEQSIKLEPNNGGVYSDLGNCFRGGFKCFKNAEELYTKAINLGFTASFVYYNRAICRYENNDLKGMREDLLVSQNLGWQNDYYKLREK